MDGAITMTRTDLANLKREYQKAVDAGEENLIWKVNGKEEKLLTSYAKYLIEYAETQFK